MCIYIHIITIFTYIYVHRYIYVYMCAYIYMCVDILEHSIHVGRYIRQDPHLYIYI